MLNANNNNNNNNNIVNSPNRKTNDAYLKITIQNLKDELDATLRDKIRAEQGFKQAMKLCNIRNKELKKIKHLVDAVAKELPAHNNNTGNMMNFRNNNNNTMQYHHNNNNTNHMIQFDHHANPIASTTAITPTRTHPSKETTPSMQRQGEPRNERFKSPKEVEKRNQRQKVERRNMQILRRRSLTGSGKGNRLPNL